MLETYLKKLQLILVLILQIRNDKINKSFQFSMFLYDCFHAKILLCKAFERQKLFHSLKGNKTS
jgi:hypothetical protein